MPLGEYHLCDTDEGYDSQEYEVDDWEVRICEDCMARSTVWGSKTPFWGNALTAWREEVLRQARAHIVSTGCK